MPTYAYKCGGCDHTFDARHSIADRKLPTEEPCTECGETKVVMMMSAPKMVYDPGTNLRNIPDGFKAITDRIKRNYKGSTIDV